MINGLTVKVCGMRSPDNIRRVEALGCVDIMGFIFYDKSPRYVECVTEYFPQSCKRAGVFVNEEVEQIFDTYHKFDLDYVQLHGTESAEFCARLTDRGIKVIKLFSIESERDLEVTHKYEGCCSLFLFDTKSALPGGSGMVFDWNVLEDYEGDTPFFLSGGIGLENVDRLRDFRHEKWCGIDLNSRFETSPAMKDVSRLARFFMKLSNNTITYE